MSGRKSNKSSEELDQHFATSEKLVGAIRAKPTNSQRATNLFYGLITAAVPVYLYSSIFEMHPQHFGILYAALTLVSAALLSFSYQNIAFQQWVDLSTRRQARVGKSKKGGTGIEKQLKAADLLAAESSSWSILYINVLFIFSVVLLGFFFFGNHLGPYNYALTMLLSSGIVLFVSGGAIR